MKKRMSKILSILLVSALVMSTGSVALAADVQEPAVKMQGDGVAEGAGSEVIPQSAVGAQELNAVDVSESVEDITAQATVEGKIPLNRIVTGQESSSNMDVGVIGYVNTAEYKKGGNNYYGYAEKVTLTRGTLNLGVKVLPQYSTHSAWFGLYKDANLLQPVESALLASKDGQTATKIFNVPSAGTYYIGVYSDISSSTSEGNAAVGAAVAAAFCDGSDNRTLTSGSQIAVGAKNEQSTYLKFKATKTGYITTSGDSAAGSYTVTLCNSKKKALSGATALRYNPTYGVKKGTTYYIKVKSYYNSNGVYTFKCVNTAIKEKSGASRAKAVTVKKGKTVKGTIQAGSSQTDWYKLNKPNNKKTTITVKGKTNDKMKVTVYRGGKKCMSRSFSYSDGGVYFTLTNYPKGTYYVKIERATKKASGWYSLNWK